MAELCSEPRKPKMRCRQKQNNKVTDTVPDGLTVVRLHNGFRRKLHEYNQICNSSWGFIGLRTDFALITPGAADDRNGDVRSGRIYRFGQRCGSDEAGPRTR